MEPYIILDGVSKSFRSVEVLKPLSIEFAEGLNGEINNKYLLVTPTRTTVAQ